MPPTGATEQRALIRPTVADFSSGDVLVRVLSVEQVNLVRDALAGLSGVRHLGEVQHGPGRALTSRDPETGDRVGLHLDNWDCRPMGARSQSSIRFAINLGPGMRGFWAGPKLLDFIVDPDCIPTTDLIRGALGSSASVEAVYLAVPPGHGYLARTEEFLHDGCTLGASDSSRLTTWLVETTCELYSELDQIIADAR